MSIRLRVIGAAVLSIAWSCAALTDPAPEDSLAGTPAAQSPWPALLGAQYTFVLQHQSALHSPYQGPLSLDPGGDTQPTNTIGFYSGWAPVYWAQLYFDTEKFMGAGVSSATGLGGLTNGDVVREGANNLPKEFYIARAYARFMLPLGSALAKVDAAQDQIGGTEAATRIEAKIGWLAVNDDFDKNRYAASTRTEFMNWSLWDNTAWDYAADTRGYTAGFVLGYVSPGWSLKFGEYRMPVRANGQELEASLERAHGDQLELTLSPAAVSTIVRVLGFYNIARMGIYSQALALAARDASRPDIVADDADGRKKYGFGLNIEQPLADDGATGLFARLGWNNGATESFAFTEVDRLASFGAELSGSHWQRGADVAGAAVALEGLSAWHREYLAAGGYGFLLGDGRLSYAQEQIFEAYYRLQLPFRWLRLQLSPDYQFIRNPGFNSARGPVSFFGIRLHAEY
jgi:high affinity Mn2+ porin